MLVRWAVSALVVSSSTVYSSPLTSRTSEPCAQISALLHQDTAEARDGLVPPAIAFSCLQSVPLEDKNDALYWLELVRPFLDWDTTIPYLRDPPDTYKLPGVDILGGFDDIVAHVENGNFKNQYELELNLTNLFISAHEGHLSLATTLVAQLFDFRRPLSLVSISSDKVSNPRPYVYNDVELAVSEPSFTPSPIVSINGGGVMDMLLATSLQGYCQDPDALYNQLFHNLALGTLGPSSSSKAAGLFTTNAYTYPGESTTFVFENGTSKTFASIATALLPFNNITSGTDVYNQYLNPPTLNTNQPAPDPITTVPRPGYPTPIASHPGNFVAGYHLSAMDSDLMSSVAILTLPTFNPGSIDEGRNCSKIMYDFLLHTSSEAGGNKSRLIVDLTGNDGGLIAWATNVFMDLFPDVYPTMLTRLRAIPPINAIGTIAEKYLDPKTEPYSPDTLAVLPFNYQQDQDIDRKPFPSWSAKYGPTAYANANYTNLMQFNISDPFYQIVSGGQNYTPPNRPFPDPSNIVLLTDGICASACSILVHYMRDIMGIRTVAVGGLPDGTQSMAAVGGTRGANAYPLAGIHGFTNLTYQLIEKASVSEAEKEADRQFLLENGVQHLLDSYETMLRRVPGGSVNSRDLIQADHVEDGVPAHFLYQPADCRIWYTMQSVTSAEALWKDVVDVAWGGKPCVWGSMGD